METTKKRTAVRSACQVRPTTLSVSFAPCRHSFQSSGGADAAEAAASHRRSAVSNETAWRAWHWQRPGPHRRRTPTTTRRNERRPGRGRGRSGEVVQHRVLLETDWQVAVDEERRVELPPCCYRTVVAAPTRICWRDTGDRTSVLEDLIYSIHYSAIFNSAREPAMAPIPLGADDFFSARQHICYSALYAIARPSGRLSVTRVDQSKTVEVRITQPSPQSSPMTLVSWRSTSPCYSKGKLGSGGAE